jgi:hypothetical protein
MRFCKDLAFLLILVTLAAYAQSFKSLTYVDNVSVPNAGEKYRTAVQLPMKCGPEGLIYVRFAVAGLESAVTSIKENGKDVSSTRLSEIPDFSENDLYDFAPASGQVFLLSGKGRPDGPTTYYVSRFKADGAYISSTVIDIGFRPDFEPREIAAFPSGNLLIAGMVKGHDVPFIPFAAIFTDAGQFVRQVDLKGDLTDKDAKKESSDASFSPAQQIRNLLEVSFLQTADDGNIYLMRHTPSGPVFVVSPGGSVRRVPLTPPAQGTDLQWIMASNGAIAAQYRSLSPSERQTHYLVVLDASTNKVRETVRYVHEYNKNGGGMACYRNGTYTFIAGGPAGGLQLVKATAQ